MGVLGVFGVEGRVAAFVDAREYIDDAGRVGLSGRDTTLLPSSAHIVGVILSVLQDCERRTVDASVNCRKLDSSVSSEWIDREVQERRLVSGLAGSERGRE